MLCAEVYVMRRGCVVEPVYLTLLDFLFKCLMPLESLGQLAKYSMFNRILVNFISCVFIFRGAAVCNGKFYIV